MDSILLPSVSFVHRIDTSARATVTSRRYRRGHPVKDLSKLGVSSNIMAIDPEFEQTYEEADTHDGHSVRTSDGE